MKLEKIVNNIEETTLLAIKIGHHLFPGAVIALEGDLGAGKTTFTKGIARALGITKTVNSPTFTIIKEYHGSMPLYHMDVYRMESEDEDLGFDEYFYGDGVTVIEWASKIKSQLPKEYLHINIYITDGERRKLEFEPHGNKYNELCEVVFSE